MSLCKTLSIRIYRNRYKHRVRECVAAVFRLEHHLESESAALGNQFIDIDIEKRAQRFSRRNLNPQGLHRNRLRARRLESLVIPTLIYIKGQCSFDVVFRNRRKPDRKSIIIRTIEIFRSHDIDLYRQRDRHFPTKRGIAHAPVVGIQRHDESGQRAARAERERKIAVLVRTQERLEGQCAGKIVSYGRFCSGSAFQ